MSKSKTLDLSNKVMKTIKSEKLQMKPRWYFWLGSVFSLIGLIAVIIISAFFISIISFSLRPHYGPGATYRLEMMWSSFPWWTIILTLLGLGIGIWMLKKYDFAYRKNFKLIILGLVLAIVAAGFLIDKTGLTEIWTKRGPMRGIMRQYLQQQNVSNTPGWRRTQD